MFRTTNSEALQYARARAVVKGLTWSLTASLESSGPQHTIKRLMKEPFLGESNATKIVSILQTGTHGTPPTPHGPPPSDVLW